MKIRLLAVGVFALGLSSLAFAGPSKPNIINGWEAAAPQSPAATATDAPANSSSQSAQGGSAPTSSTNTVPAAPGVSGVGISDTSTKRGPKVKFDRYHPRPYAGSAVGKD